MANNIEDLDSGLKNQKQWNAEIRIFRFQTAPKSGQNVVPFPDVQISDIRAVRFVQFEILNLSQNVLAIKGVINFFVYKTV